MSLGNSLDVAEVLLPSFNEPVAHQLVRQPFALPCPVGQEFRGIAVFCERHGLGWPRIALDFDAIRTLARVTARDCSLALMRPAGLAPTWRLRVPLTLHQRAGMPVTVGRHLGDLGLDFVEQEHIAGRWGRRVRPSTQDSQPA